IVTVAPLRSGSCSPAWSATQIQSTSARIPELPNVRCTASTLHARCPEEPTDHVAQQSGTETDDEQLHTAPSPVADERDRGVRADAEQRRGAQQERDDERRHAREE